MSEGFVGGHVVPISELCKTVEAASGKTGLQKKLVGMKTYPVALVANGLSPLRLLSSWWSGAELDALRNGPLDKHGVGSRILDATAQVHESEIARLAEFGKDWPDPCDQGAVGRSQQLSQPRQEAEISRAAAERRLGDRALYSQRLGALAVLDAEARGRAPEAVLPRRAGFRSEGCRLPGGGRRRQVLQDRRNHVLEADSHGRAINGNSVLGHSLEADKGQDMKTYKNGVIGRTLTEDERYDLIEYLKTL